MAKARQQRIEELKNVTRRRRCAPQVAATLAEQLGVPVSPSDFSVQELDAVGELVRPLFLYEVDPQTMCRRAWPDRRSGGCASFFDALAARIGQQEVDLVTAAGLVSVSAELVLRKAPGLAAVWQEVILIDASRVNAIEISEDVEGDGIVLTARGCHWQLACQCLGSTQSR